MIIRIFSNIKNQIFLPNKKSNFSSNIKDVAEAILVLLVIGDFLFQTIDENLRLGSSGWSFRKASIAGFIGA